MKTDLERYVELYRSFGIELTVRWTDDRTQQYVAFGHHCRHECNEHVSFDGYSGFYTAVYFDRDGKYVSQEFME